MIGRTLSHFRITAKLGAGGMGEVYRAEDTKLGREVAIKVLPQAFSVDPERLARFEREARLLAALKHPAIVAIHSVEEADGVPFLVMELVEGHTLGESIPRGGMKLSEILRIGIPLAEALESAHASGITHRDLKPGNIMVDADRRPKVLDFGLAKPRGPAEAGVAASEEETAWLSSEGQLVGTTPYMPPEQLRGQAADHRSDIFALGVVLYEMATGERPFGGATPIEVANAILSRDPRPLTELRADLPADLSRLVHRCLAKEPARRIQTAQDVSNQLREIADEEAISASIPPPDTPPRSTARRAGRWALAGGLAVVAALVAWALLLRQPAAPPPVPTPHSPSQPSIAVLPLDNLGPPETEYFADGMTEAVIMYLAKIEDLRVISRSSVMGYKAGRPPAQQIAEELGVEFLVEGSVLRVGDQARITAQLIRGASDEHLWAESYDGTMADILALQSQVAQAIAQEVGVRITPEEQTRLGAARRVDPTAYEIYLKGLQHLHRGSEAGPDWRQSFEAAIEQFQAAIEHEPDWPEPYGELATTYHWLGSSTRDLEESDRYYRLSREAAERALALDPDLPSGHSALAWVSLFHDWDWAAAEREYRRLHALVPNSHDWGYAIHLHQAGRYEEAIERFRHARERRPGNRLIRFQLGRAYLSAGRLPEAQAIAEDLLAEDRRSQYGLFLSAQVLLAHGRAEEAAALVDAELLVAGDPASERVQILRGYAYAKAGRTAAARLVVADLQRAGVRYFPELHLALGDEEAAVQQIEQAFLRRDAALLGILGSPEIERLRQLPRVEAVIQRVGFPSVELPARIEPE